MPERFGRYELLGPIGRGGMAELFRARLSVPGGAEKLLVVKRILSRFSGDPEFLKMFVNEARIALPLTHGNITSVFEFGEVDGQYFLAMEYIYGQSLDAILQRLGEVAIPMPEPAALFLAAEVAKGLAYAHGYTSPSGERIEVVHLDVSPHNVLVSYDGAVKLTDFGIAKLKHSADGALGPLRGKPNYVSPEQLRPRDQVRVDGRTDIFALGSVLYQMLTGRPPFDAPTDAEILQRVQSGELAPPSAVRPGLARYDALVMRALAAAPDQRYARASDFAAALNQALVERAPGFSAQALGDWVRELFAWDIVESQGAQAAANLRDRLLFQLAHAEVSLDPARSTKELLQLGTVSIPPPRPVDLIPHDADDRAARFKLWAFWAGLAALAAALTLFLGRHFFGADVSNFTVSMPGLTPRVDAGETTGADGLLSINAWPRAVVFIDGERQPRSTPITNLPIKPGKHKLRFERPELGLVKEVEVVVPAGGSRTVAIKLDR